MENYISTSTVLGTMLLVKLEAITTFYIVG